MDTAHIAVEQLDATQAEQELARLSALIAHLNHAYHAKDAPEVSDAEFDALRRRNEAIELRFPTLMRMDSPRFQVGAAPSSAFKNIGTSHRCCHWTTYSTGLISRTS